MTTGRPESLGNRDVGKTHIERIVDAFLKAFPCQEHTFK